MKRRPQKKKTVKRYSAKRRRRKLIGEKRKFRIHINWSYLPVIGKWIFEIAVVVLLAFVGVWYFGQRVSMVGESMKPVLRNGDVVLVNRIVYNATKPKRGDIIVFKPNGNENSHYYIKRIVGLPGESVEIIENSIYINGGKLEEEYTTTAIDDVGIVSEKMTLGSDEYFVLGDDRENSEDSRNADVGNVKRSYIYGKAWFIVSPRGHFGRIKE